MEALKAARRAEERPAAAVIGGRVVGVAVRALPFLLAVAVYATALAVMQPATTGDEPHYLLLSESLAYDRDVDMRNDYESADRTLAVHDSFPLERQAAEHTGDELVPVHQVGLSLLLLPAVVLGGDTLARVVMVVISALLADQLWRLLRQIGVARPARRTAAWVAVAFCLPVLVFSSQIYPEIPGALLIVTVLRVIFSRAASGRRLIVASLACAALPWLHVRFLVVAAPLLLGLAYAATPAAPGSSLVARLRMMLRDRPGATAVILLPPAVSVALLLGTFEAWYGTPYPGAPYRPFFSGTIGSGGWNFLYEHLLPDILHPAFGWIPYAPVHWLAIAGIGLGVWRFGWVAACVLAGALLYAVFVASTGVPLGYQLPGRILVAVVPLAAVPLALVLEHVRVGRWVFAPLLAASLALAVAAVGDLASLYQQSGLREDARLLGIRSIQSAFPDTRPREVPTPVVVEPGDFEPFVGRVTGGRAVASDASGDRPGVIVYGPHRRVPPGLWTATFDLAGFGPRAARLGTASIVTAGEQALASRPVFAAELERGRLTEIVVPFAVAGPAPIDARVEFAGEGTLVAGSVHLVPAGAAGSDERFPDWPLAFLWVAGTVLIGALFVQVASRPPSPHR